MPVLEKMVDDFIPDQIDHAFQLWLTSVPSSDFPVSIL
jgi:hypothetical protein